MRLPAFGRGLLVAFVAVPLITAVVTAMLRVPPGGTALLMVMSVCPGVALMTTTIRKRGGDLALGAALTLVMTLMAIVLLPLTLGILNRIYGFGLRANIGDLFVQVGLPVLLATGVGVAVRTFLPRVAHALFPVVMVVFKVALAIVVVVLAVKGFPAILRSPMVLLATVLITLAGAAVGHLFGGQREAERRTIAIAASYGNPVLVLVIAKLSYPTIDALPAVAVYLVVRIATLGAYLAWLDWKSRRGSEPPESRGPRAPIPRVPVPRTPAAHGI